MADLTPPLPIIALDVAKRSDAMATVDELGDLCRFFKVGNELFTGAGPEVVVELCGRRCEIFLDLKFHDIPTTVAGAVRNAAALGVRLVTVHAAGGETMLAAAVAAAGDQTVCGILAVTVLTSLTTADVSTTWGRAEPLDLSQEVLRLAGLAAAAGAHGIVCSGREAAAVRDRYGDRLSVLVPGVRLAGADHADQARVSSPREAALAGARYIVLGRAVTKAANPRQVLSDVLRELR